MNSMKTEHTPGPWFVDLDFKLTDSRYHQVRGPGIFSITGCLDIHDARIIAAAPIMLETLRGIFNHLSFLRDSIEGDERKELDESLDKILVAINKATGANYAAN